MKQLIIAIIGILIIDLLTNSCANPISPTGGAKDTIPPTLVESNPENQALNFSSKELILVFDEKITADKLRSNLIITPLSEITFKSFVKKNTITITFEEEFEDSTTYTLNFFDGITDITEKNPSENLILAFSTGPFIDSLSINGKIRDLFTNKESSEYIIGLYKITDTLDFKKNKPTYFTSSIDDGTFQINNIKAGKYKIFAFKDENKNLLFEAQNESYAFYNDTLILSQENIDSISLKSLSFDASKFDFNSSRPSGTNFEIRYSKQISEYKIKNELDLFTPSKIVGESDVIRIYPFASPFDSTRLIITALDTLKNSRTDTVFAMFKESSRKPEDYTSKLLPKNNAYINQNTLYHIQLNKPSILADTNFLYLAIDTLADIPITKTKSNFDDQHMDYQFSFQIEPEEINHILDSIKLLFPYDSLTADSVNLPIQNNLGRIKNESFNIFIKQGAFISVENDTSDIIESRYRFEEPGKYGKITLTVETDKTSYYVQLMKNDQKIREIYNCKTCLFEDLDPDDYWFRVLHDSDNDSTWTYGNFNQNIEPEPIYFFQEETTLRANWEVEINISF